MMDFGNALSALKTGHQVARKGWNGKGMWLRLIPEMVEGTTGRTLVPYVQMKAADDTLVPWLASQTDILATDWEII